MNWWELDNNNNNNNTAIYLFIIYYYYILFITNCRVHTNTNNNRNKITQDKTKSNKINNEMKKNWSVKLFTLKHELLTLRTALAVATRLVEGQWLEEQVNMLKLRIFRIGTRRLFRGQGQHLAPLKIFVNNKVWKWRRLLCSVSKFNHPDKLS
jgi:hypothetical protein